MARDLTAAMASGLTQRVLNAVLLAEFEFDSGTSYMWSGVGDLVWNGNTYNGAGDQVGITQYTEVEDMQAQGMGFVLSGVKASLLSTVYEENYQGRACRLYLGLIGSAEDFMLFESGATILFESGDGKLLESSGAGAAVLTADPYQWFEGLMNVAKIDRPGDTATITLSAENETIILTQTRARRYTPEDQKAEYPDDLGMDFATTLPDRQVIWGQKTS